MLTSLIDVIFLLVIFFMVSSQITPFSLIPLGAPAASGEGGAVAGLGGTPAVAVRVLAGRTMVGGHSVELTALPAALAQLRDNGVESLLVMPAGSATVQDIVAVLEAVKRSGIPKATVINRRGGS